MKTEIPYADEELLSCGEVRTFTGQALSQIAFPLGGIGTGTVSLGGRGQLLDWEIFNRPSKGTELPMTFFAVWAEMAEEESVAKILERRLLPPYAASNGLCRDTLGGVARMDEAVFRGEYPFATIKFLDEDLPVEASLEAFNPFIPLNVEDSSIPGAIFIWSFRNPTNRPVKLSLLSTMQNPIGWRDIGVKTDPFPARANQYRSDGALRGLWFSAPGLSPNDPNYGTAALTTTWTDLDVQTRLYRGGWWDSAHMLWGDFAADGALDSLIEAEYGDGKEAGTHDRPEAGALAMRAVVPPESSVSIPVVITWHVPHVKCWTDGIVARTYAARQFEDAWAAARYTADHLERLTRETRNWRDAVSGSTLPSIVVDAATSQASTIRTQTCLRLADGQFYGYEGCRDSQGCCPGTCTHVWNYEQALAFLFPSLERSVRRNEFLNSMWPDGHMTFRTSAPANARLRRYHACADGQMGAVIRAYRDWQISGDDSFIREIWPGVKLALEYAWTQPNGWDPNKDGVMEGCQHNTYDIEFYGPNTMMGAMYLGALRAAEEIARYFGETDRAEEYRAIYESGRARTEEDLWNGEYYFQEVKVMEGLEVPEPLRGPAVETCDCKQTPGPKTPARQGFEVKYQYGEGCLSDQLLGQWASHVADLGYVLDASQVKQAVRSIFDCNFRKPIGAFSNVQRIYALNDEAGLLVCSWPRGNRPRLPFVYSDEVWTGIEYQVAAHLIYEGHLRRGLALVKAVRDRHDGLRRNPWNEFECGHHYARAMSSWSLLLALSGYSYSAVSKRIGFAPRINEEAFRTFFSTGSGWGCYEQKAQDGRFEAELDLRYGCLELQSINFILPHEHASAEDVQVRVSGETVEASAETEGSGLTVRFAETVRLSKGLTLTVTV